VVQSRAAPAAITVGWLAYSSAANRTQDEGRCPVRDTTTARDLSLFRSLAIFLFKRQDRGKSAKQSLPDFERHVHRKPGGANPPLHLTAL